MLVHQNNYIGNSSIMSDAAKSSATSLSVLHNYFNNPKSS